MKVVKTRAEEGRVAVRNVRRHARQELEELEKDGEISKDELDRVEKDLEKLTHEVVAEIDELLTHKEQELPRGLSSRRPRASLRGRLSGAVTGRGGRSSLGGRRRRVRRIACSEHDDERPEAPPAEGVRILGAEEAQAAVEGGPDRRHARGAAAPASPRPRRPTTSSPRPASRFPADRLPGDEPGTVDPVPRLPRRPTDRRGVGPDAAAALDRAADRRGAR